ncbi:ribonuclease [Corynebacterium canis]|uniref:Ribonuclease n=1 Tax=Corynebacterium canis TaxID=679663 RepID=A0A5C5URC6_9CORY|nr:ribonuclease domain-containing protein [Corynebacterium canis]TWT28548.1 ribonuclease [Corynebacterium canis]
MNRVLKGLGAVALLVAAAWLGIDLSQGDLSQGGESSESSQAKGVQSSPTAQTNTSTDPKTPTKPNTSSPTSPTSPTRLPSCPTATLPDQAHEVIDDILAGGPFEHPEYDGTHFGNYERILPRQNSNFYREYTVDTPGVRHRGERRIVVGGGTKQDPDTWYYTDDHYESFCEIPDAEQ